MGRPSLEPPATTPPPAAPTSTHLLKHQVETVLLLKELYQLENVPELGGKSPRHPEALITCCPAWEVTSSRCRVPTESLFSRLSPARAPPRWTVERWPGQPPYLCPWHWYSISTSRNTLLRMWPSCFSMICNVGRDTAPGQAAQMPPARCHQAPDRPPRHYVNFAAVGLEFATSQTAVSAWAGHPVAQGSAGKEEEAASPPPSRRSPSTKQLPHLPQ